MGDPSTAALATGIPPQVAGSSVFGFHMFVATAVPWVPVFGSGLSRQLPLSTPSTLDETSLGGAEICYSY